jgi:hypothetical protein
MYMREGNVSGCGIRAFAIVSGTLDDLRGFGLSVNVMQPGWVKAPNATATRPNEAVI